MPRPLFSKNKKEEKKMSIADAIHKDKQKTIEATKLDITNALVETEAQKEVYRLAALRAINKAKRAEANNNVGEKNIAYNELKFAYGVYHYMDTLHTAFRSIESQMQMQEMTQNFAKVVNSLKSIRVPQSSVDFNKLTATALKGMDSIDFAGLDEMVNQLIHGSINATEASRVDSQFLDDLVSGRASLDTPYPVAGEEVTAVETAQDQAAGQAAGEAPSDANDLLAMLDQINAGLNGK